MDKRQIDVKIQPMQRIKGLVDNIHIENSTEDELFHLGLVHKNDDLMLLFKDVKFVCMSGPVDRTKNFVTLLKSEMKQISSELDERKEPIDFTKNGNRFSMFKIGCVLCVNHGIGYSSITIVLHEIIKLLHYARVRDPIIFRIGTSGGVGLTSGTVVIAEKAYNDFLEEFFEISVLAKRIRLPAILDENLAADLKSLALKNCSHIPVVSGKTMSHEHFYESVASVKASICYCDDDTERNDYFDLLKRNNILNADMEVVAIAAITNRLGIKAAVVNVVVNDLSHPIEDVDERTLTEWQIRPQRIVSEYIKQYLRQNVYEK